MALRSDYELAVGGGSTCNNRQLNRRCRWEPLKQVALVAPHHQQILAPIIQRPSKGELLDCRWHRGNSIYAVIARAVIQFTITSGGSGWCRNSTSRCNIG